MPGRDLPDELRQRIAKNVTEMSQGGDWWNRFLRDMARHPLVAESSLDRPEPPLLTEAELAVLKCISRGLKIPEAAVVLGKGMETVKTQAKTASQRLGTKTTAHAACEAIRRGLIP